MKSKMAILALALSFGTSVQAAETVAVERPTFNISVFEEGTEARLSADQIKDLIPWANRANLVLRDLLEETKGKSNLETKHLLLDGIRKVVLGSAPKRTELLMRYVLNRSLKVVEVLEQEVDAKIDGAVDRQVRVLKQSIAYALKYYRDDLQFLSGSVRIRIESGSELPFFVFGYEYAEFLNQLNRSVVHAKAQLQIQDMILGFLSWDLYRDSSRIRFAPAIVRLDSAVKLIPVGAPEAELSDSTRVQYIAQLKKAYSQATALLRELSKEIARVEEERGRTEVRFGDFVLNGKKLLEPQPILGRMNPGTLEIELRAVSRRRVSEETYQRVEMGPKETQPKVVVTSRPVKVAEKTLQAQTSSQGRGFYFPKAEASQWCAAMQEVFANEIYFVSSTNFERQKVGPIFCEAHVRVPVAEVSVGVVSKVQPFQADVVLVWNEADWLGMDDRGMKHRLNEPQTLQFYLNQQTRDMCGLSLSCYAKYGVFGSNLDYVIGQLGAENFQTEVTVWRKEY